MQMFIILVVWPLVLAVVLNTRQPKTPVRRWLSILLPPVVLFCVLLMFPFHRYTMHFIWFPAILALYISIGSVLIRLILAVSQAITKSSSTSSVLLGLIRPILVVVIVGGFKMRDSIAISSTVNYASALAIEIQKTYDPNVVCPEILRGWVVEQSNPTYSMCSYTYKRYGREMAMKYENIKLAGEFSLSVGYFGFAWIPINGGKERTLELPPAFNKE